MNKRQVFSIKNPREANTKRQGKKRERERLMMKIGDLSNPVNYEVHMHDRCTMAYLFESTLLMHFRATDCKSIICKRGTELPPPAAAPNCNWISNSRRYQIAECCVCMFHSSSLSSSSSRTFRNSLFFSATQAFDANFKCIILKRSDRQPRHQINGQKRAKKSQVYAIQCIRWDSLCFCKANSHGVCIALHTTPSF